MRKRVMNLRPYLGILMCVTVLFAGLQVPVAASTQLPVDSVSIDDVSYTTGEDSSGTTVMTPTMTVSWENPDSWLASGDTEEYDPDYFDINLENITLGTEETITAYENSDIYSDQTVDLEDETELDTGSLYAISVEPYHYEEDEDENRTLVGSDQDPEVAYAITDLDVTLESGEDSITVIWDDVGIEDFTYRIVYALGDYSSDSKETLVDDADGEVTDLTQDSEGVTSYYDSDEKRDKLSYTLDENISPGQVYSVMVEPTVSYYEGNSIARNVNYPMIHTTSTNVELSYTLDGDDLEFQWEIPSSFKVGSDSDQYELTETTLVQYRDGQGENLVIFNGDAGTIGHYTITAPSEETQYQLELTYEAVDDSSKEAIDAVSNTVTYSPSDTSITPTEPQIPDLLSQDTLDALTAANDDTEVRSILADNYLIEGTTYLDALEDIFDAGVTYSVDTDNNEVSLVWSSFRRKDTDEDSDTYNETITDLDTSYDIWVTNSLESLEYATEIVEDATFSEDDEDVIEDEDGEIQGFHTTLDTYYNDDTGEIEDIEANQVYYIKIVAKKEYNEEELTSDPAVTTFYYTDDGDVYEPPILAKPPLEIEDEDTSTTSLTLSWQEDWWEVMIYDEDGEPATINDGEDEWSWSPQVWYDGTTLSMDEFEGATQYDVYEGESVIDDLETDLGSDYTVIRRHEDMGTDAYGVSDIQYEFAYVTYAAVEEAMEENDYTFLEYFNEVVTEHEEGNSSLSWDEITPTESDTDEDRLEYTQDNLLPNTSYMLLLYPYRVVDDEEVLYAHYPSYILGATDDEYEETNPDPTVPTLYVTDSEEQSLELQWVYNTDFSYEIVYAEDDDIDEAEAYDFELPDESDDDYPVSGDYYAITVDDLFPDTGYYFYIRATNITTGSSSDWSNATYGSTLDVDNPDAPSGVGIASDSTMDDYGYDSGIGEDYLAIDWLADSGETDNEDDDNVKTYYSYIMEVGTSKAFTDPQYIISGDDALGDSVIPDNVEVLEKTLLKINNLVDNRYYYIRMKTRKTVVGSGDDELIVKESTSYSDTLRVRTGSSSDEYDGNPDPTLEVLPDDNYELIYDEDDETLTYRFRSDDEDEDGNADNSVDQRLITELIDDNSYTYDIDISSYDNNPITKRKVVIPYSIVSAFDEYDITMTIDAGDITMSIPHDALSEAVDNLVNQYGQAPSVEIIIKDVDAFYEKSQMPEDALQSVSVPQQVTIKLKSDLVTDSLEYTQEAITYGLVTSSRYEIYEKNPVVYALDSNRRWNQMEGSYDRVEGAYMISTKEVGAYGVYLTNDSSEIESQDTSHWSEKYKQDIDDLYTISGLDTYDPDDAIDEDSFLNVVYSVALGKSEVDMDAYISSDQLNALYYSGIKTDTSSGASTVSRQEAISMMMEAIAMKNQMSIKISSSVQSQVDSDTSVDSAYKSSIAKAVQTGLVSSLSDLRADDALTYGELFALWDKAESL